MIHPGCHVKVVDSTCPLIAGALAFYVLLESLLDMHAMASQGKDRREAMNHFESCIFGESLTATILHRIYSASDTPALEGPHRVIYPSINDRSVNALSPGEPRSRGHTESLPDSIPADSFSYCRVKPPDLCVHKNQTVALRISDDHQPTYCQ